LEILLQLVQLLKKGDGSTPEPEKDSEDIVKPVDIELSEYEEMIDCCRFLSKTIFEGNPYKYAHTAFGDHRDRYSIFYLSGNDQLLDNSVQRGFDPIRIARSLPGVFVDCIKEYPPPKRTRQRSHPRGRKWRMSGKCKG